MFFYGLGLYLVGASISYLLAEYFDWEACFEEGPPAAITGLLWFIVLPIIVLMQIGAKVKDLGSRNRQKKAQKIRVRIAEQEKINHLQAEAEQEVERYYQELQNKTDR